VSIIAPVTASNVGSIPSTTPHPESATISIFGASGDLTARKLLPALFDLWSDGYLTDEAPIVGVARREKSDESFRNEIYEAINGNVRAGQVSQEKWGQFAKRLYYRQLDIAAPDGYPAFRQQLEAIEKQQGTEHNRVFYMATSPDLFLPAVENLGFGGLIPDRDAAHTMRVVFEKPFGRDLTSAQELSGNLRRLLREEQIYRIDHYRFSNRC
jgi:glucose-6-phosphate 1-dehydrogenase